MDDKQLWDLLGNSDPIEPSPDFALRFWQKADRRVYHRRFLLRGAAPAFAAVLLVFLGIFFFPQYTGRETVRNIEFNGAMVSADALLDATLSFRNVQDVAAEMLTADEIVEALVPGHLRGELRELTKGGELL